MITAQVSLGNLLKKIKHCPEKIHQEIQESIMREGRLLVSSSGKVPGLVQVTPPSQGKSDTKSKQRGEAKVASDIRKAYGSASDLWRLIRDKAGVETADSFWAFIKQGKKKKANQIAMRIVAKQLVNFDYGTEHKKRRNPNNGRVVGGFQPRDKNVFLSPSQQGKLNTYIKRTQKNVGMLAASLPIAASPRLGKINGVPNWIGRHGGRNRWGKCQVQRTPRSLWVRVGISSRGVTDLQRRFDYVLSYRSSAFKRQIPYIKRAALKKSQLTLT